MSFFLLLLVSMSKAQIPAFAQSADLSVLTHEYQKAPGLFAEFNQKTEILATKQTKRSSGRLWIKKPNKLRWETLEPDANILVSDGKTFWFYTPPFESGDRGQVIIKKSAQVQTQFLNSLLVGDFGEKLGASIEKKSKSTFLLTPKKSSAGDVKSALIELNADLNRIQKVSLTHTTGNKTEIELRSIKLQGDLAETLFKFNPDRNTDKIFE